MSSERITLATCNYPRFDLLKARKWLDQRSGPQATFSVLSRPKEGGSLSGDAYLIRPVHDGTFFSVIDALGHGPEANRTVELALGI